MRGTLSPQRTNGIAVRILATTFFLFSALIYFPLLGRVSETQPVIAMLLAILLVGVLLVSLPKTLRASPFLIGVFGFAAFIFLHSFLIAELVEWQELPRFLAGPIFFLAAVTLAPYFGANALRIALLFFAIGGVLEAFANPLYQVLNSYISADREAGVAFSLRGLRYFTPEPTYSVLALFYLMVLTYYLKETGKIAAKNARFYFATIVTMLLLTLSSYALLLFFILGFAHVIRGRNLALQVGSVILTPALVIIAANTETRAGELLRNLAEVDFGSIVQTFFLAEPSFSTRILRFSAGVQGLLSEPLGYGIGSFQSIYWQHFNTLQWDWVRFHEVIGKTYFNRTRLEPDSYLTALIHDLGIFGAAIFSGFLWRIRSAFGRTPTEAGFFLAACFMLTVQAQLTNPVPWVTLALLYHLAQLQRHLHANATRMSAYRPGERILG